LARFPTPWHCRAFSSDHRGLQTASAIATSDPLLVRPGALVAVSPSSLACSDSA
jgi:hypothetical protein